MKNESGLFTADGTLFMFVHFEGTVHVSPVYVSSPRDNSKDLDTQAFDEIQDSGYFEEIS